MSDQETSPAPRPRRGRPQHQPPRTQQSAAYPPIGSTSTRRHRHVRTRPSPPPPPPPSPPRSHLAYGGGDADIRGHGPRNGDAPGVGLACLLICLICYFIWPSDSSTPLPPCHAPYNPDHLVSCAVFIDVNRALTEISDLWAVQSLIPYSSLEGPEVEHNLISEFDMAARSVQSTMKSTESDISLQFEFTKEKIFALVPPRNFIDFLFWISNMQTEPFLDFLLWAVNLRTEPSLVGLEATKQDIFRLLNDTANNATSQLPEMVSTIANTTSVIHDILNNLTSLRYSIDTDIQFLSTAYHSQHSSSSSYAILSKLHDLRKSLIRTLINEAIITCWLETNHQLLTRFSAVHFRSRIDNEASDKAGFFDLRTLAESQLHDWTQEALRVFYNAHVDSSVTPRAVASCAKRFAFDNFGHCLPGISHDNVSTSMDPTGQGCLTHPDPVWWEWHNAIHMVLTQPPEDEENEKMHRHWTSYIATPRQTAQYTKVEKGARGVVIPFRQDFPLRLGVIKLHKFFNTSGASPQEGDK